MPPTMPVGLVLGGVAGWVSNEAYRRYAKSKKYGQLQQYNVQKKLASLWSDDYEAQVWDSNWDKRAPQKQSQESLVDENNNTIVNKKSTATRHILLVRHGQYNMREGDDNSHTLTTLGLEQASQTGKRLAQLNLPITRMVVSTMIRAKQTADEIEKQLPAPIERVSTDLLREGAPFPPEPHLGHWKPDVKQFLTDGQRIEEGFREFFHRAEPDREKDSYELVVCHANVIRYIVCRSLQLPPEAWARISLKHASITWVSIRPSGRVILRLLGDSGFMPPNMLTS